MTHTRYGQVMIAKYKLLDSILEEKICPRDHGYEELKQFIEDHDCNRICGELSLHPLQEQTLPSQNQATHNSRKSSVSRCQRQDSADNKD